jgi:hypothetical protein
MPDLTIELPVAEATVEEKISDARSSMISSSGSQLCSTERPGSISRNASYLAVRIEMADGEWLLEGL